MKLHVLTNRKKLEVFQKKKVKCAKKKLGELNEIMCTVANIDQTLVYGHVGKDEQHLENTQKNSEDFKYLFNKLKRKFTDTASTYHEKIEILALKPDSWSRQKFTNFFGPEHCTNML